MGAFGAFILESGVGSLPKFYKMLLPHVGILYEQAAAGPKNW